MTHEGIGIDVDTRIRKAEAKADLLKAQTDAAAAVAELETISGAHAALERARKRFAALKQETLAERVEGARRAVETALEEFESAIDRASARFTEWDHTNQKLIRARLDEVGAKIRIDERKQS